MTEITSYITVPPAKNISNDIKQEGESKQGFGRQGCTNPVPYWNGAGFDIQLVIVTGQNVKYEAKQQFASFRLNIST